MILRRGCVAVDDDEIRMMTTVLSRMMTMLLGLMMTMLSEGDEGRGVELSGSAPPSFTGDRQRFSGFTRRESSSQPLITDYFHLRYWVPASCTSSNGFLSSLLGRS